MKLPFIQENFDNYLIRTFSKDVETDELKWHFDNENRKVTILEGTDWEFQMDDELPITIKKNTPIFIPEGTYHRIIKGTGDLIVKVKKHLNTTLIK